MLSRAVFKLFKNHKNQRSQIVIFHIENLQSAKNQSAIDIFMIFK